MKCALNGTVLLNENCHFANTKTVENIYCIHHLNRYTAVFSVVTQRSSPQRALRDDTKNDCVADYDLKRCATKWKENT